ncbi:MAG: vWA domain-containing protein [Gemmatimonas sp.]
MTFAAFAFASPVYIGLATFALPAAIVILVRLEHRRQTDLAAIGDPLLLECSSALPDRRQRVVAQALALSALTLVVLSLARPQFGTAPATLTGSGRTVLFVLDLSRSMNARDVAPSRLVAAKRSALDIASALKRDRVGLVVFGGSAFLQLPPTLDQSELALFLDAASSDDIPDPGTSVETAIEVAAAALARDGASDSRAIVLLTDGEDREGELTRAAETLKRQHLRVFAVGVGTAEGAEIPELDSTGLEREHRDWAGRVVTTRLQEARLRGLAAATGGAYVRWDSDESVRPIIDAISQLEPHSTFSQTRRPEADRFQWPLALALAAVFAETLVQRRGRRPAPERRRS